MVLFYSKTTLTQVGLEVVTVYTEMLISLLTQLTLTMLHLLMLRLLLKQMMVFVLSQHNKRLL